MSNHSQPQQSQIQTVVKLYGDQSENIAIILQNMNLNPVQQQNVKTVLEILYSKIDRLREERNCLKVSLYQHEQKLMETRREADSLKNQLEVQREQIEQMTVKSNRQDQYTFDVQAKTIDMTPPLKQTYLSVQLNQGVNQNLPPQMEELKYVSQFESQPKQFDREYLSLMKKYNLTPSEFKKVLILYMEDERKVLKQLQTNEQRELYLQSKKSKNYHEWVKKMRKECSRGQKMGSDLSSLPSQNDFMR